MTNLKYANLKGRLLLSTLVILVGAMTAAAQSASDKCRPAGVIPLAAEPPAKIVIDPPLWVRISGAAKHREVPVIRGV